MKRKKYFCAFLAALCVFTSCARAPGVPPASSAAPDAGCALPLGRFVETEITPPALKALSDEVFDAMGVFAHTDGSLDYFVTIAKAGAHPPVPRWTHYRSADGGDTWELVDMAWMDTLRSRYGDKRFGAELRMDDEQNIYCLVTDQKAGGSVAPLHLFRIAPGGSPEEIPVTDFADPAFYDAMGVPVMDAFERLPDGKFLFDFRWEERRLLLYDEAAGERVAELRNFPDFPGTGNLYRSNCFVTTVIDGLQGERLLATYDYSGKLLFTGPSLKEVNGNEPELRLCAGKDGEIFLVGREGVSRGFSGGSYWETLLDGAQYHFGRADMDILHVACGGDGGDFYMGLRAVGGSGYPESLLYRYAFDEAAPVVPDDVVTVFSMTESETLIQAVTVFQTSSRGCRVDVKLPPQGMPPEEAARIVAGEMAAGHGPDLILLDGLPPEPLRETGTLADLSDLVQSEEYFGNLVSAFESGGKIDAVPTRVIVPLMLGDQVLLDSLEELPALTALARQTTGPDEPLTADFRLYYEPMQLFYGLYAPLLKGPEGEEKLTELLENTKALWDLYGGDISPEDVEGFSRSWAFPVGAFAPEDHYRGKTRLGVANCGECRLFSLWSDMGYSESEKGDPRYPPLTMEPLFRAGVYYPTGVAAVNAHGPNPQGAMAFLKTLLSYEVQTVESMDSYTGEGLPVNRKAFEDLVRPDPWIVYASDPVMLMMSLDTPVTLRLAELEAVAAELPAFYGGEEDALEVARRILKAVK